MSRCTPARNGDGWVLLMLAYLLVMLQILCLFRLMERRKLGLLITMGITVVGATAVSYIKSLKWIFPLTHAIFGEHFDRVLCAAVGSVMVFGIVFYSIKWWIVICKFIFAKRCQIADEVY